MYEPEILKELARNAIREEVAMPDAWLAFAGFLAGGACFAWILPQDVLRNHAHSVAWAAALLLVLFLIQRNRRKEKADAAVKSRWEATEGKMSDAVRDADDRAHDANTRLSAIREGRPQAAFGYPTIAYTKDHGLEIIYAGKIEIGTTTEAMTVGAGLDPFCGGSPLVRADFIDMDGARATWRVCDRDSKGSKDFARALIDSRVLTMDFRAGERSFQHSRVLDSREVGLIDAWSKSLDG